MGGFLTVNETNFEDEVLNSPLPVMVEFNAAWCEPCKRLEPILEQWAEDWSGSIKLVKLNVDENIELAMHYQIMSVPTMILFIQGEPEQRLSGLHSRDRIDDKFDSFLNN